MKKRIQLLVGWSLLFALALSITTPSAVAQAPSASAPRVFLLNPQKLSETRRRVLKGDQSFAAALAKLEAEGENGIKGRAALGGQ